MIDTDKMCQRLKQPCSKRVPLNPNMEEALPMPPSPPPAQGQCKASAQGPLDPKRKRLCLCRPPAQGLRKASAKGFQEQVPDTNGNGRTERNVDLDVSEL